MIRVSSIALSLGFIAGCSVINSFDEVKPALTANGGADSGAAAGGKGAGGKGAGGGGTADSGAGGTSGGAGGGIPDSGADGSTGGVPADGSAGSSGAGGGATGGGPGDAQSDVFVPGGPTGALVTYDPGNSAVVPKVLPKLWVLDPVDGHEISQESSVRVLAIAHDGFSDLWYIFQQPGDVFSPAQVEVRELNVTTGRWRVRGAPVVVPNPATSYIGVLNGRLAYLSTPNPQSPDPTASTLTVLDTTDPDLVKVLTPITRVLPAGGKAGLLANPDGSNTGGSVTIALTSATCAGTQCGVDLFRVSVTGASVQEDPAGPKNVGAVNATAGAMGLTFDLDNRYDVILAPPVDLQVGQDTACLQNHPTTGTAQTLDPATHAAIGSPVAFNVGSARISGAAFDPCHHIAFGTSLLNDPAIWAIPFAAGGTPFKLCSTAGGSMFFEPYTKAALRIPTAGDRIEIYDIDATDPKAPTITKRSPLNIPAKFSIATQVMAVRFPMTGYCGL